MIRKFQSLLIAASLVCLSNGICSATSPNSNIECRIYDPNKRCVWVLKSNPYPVPYVVSKAPGKRYYSKKTPNPILSPLPIVAEQKAINQQASVLKSTMPEAVSNTKTIVMDTTTGIKPVEQKPIHINGTMILTTPSKQNEQKSLSGHVEIKEIIPAKKMSVPEAKPAAKVIKIKPVELDKLKADYSWVNTISSSIHERLAEEVVQFISHQRPDTKTVLKIKPVVQTDNKLTPLLLQKLKDKGYGIASEQAQLVAGTNIRYIIDETQGGILVRIQLENSEGSKWYVLDQSKSNLLAVSPFTVKRGSF